MIIIGIDPGPEMSAVAKIDTNSNPILLTAVTRDSLTNHRWGNELIKNYLIQILSNYHRDIIVIACETFECQGRPVGKVVFDAISWIGEFRCISKGFKVEFMELRSGTDINMNICGIKNPKKGYIAQALRDRFGEKGTVKNPGPTFGFALHTWDALAAAATAYDRVKGEIK